jgi:uncharacterized membrane-anchored protein
MLSCSRSTHENIVYVVVALAAFLAEPTIVRAQGDYNWVNFTKPLALSRGSLTASSPGALYLNHEDTCNLLVEEWAWDREHDCPSIESLVVGTPDGVDSFIVAKPNNDGFVVFDDWDADTDEEIDAIWDSYVEGMADQSKQLGIEIKPIDWYVYPTLNKDRALMYYAILSEWNGEPTINIHATLFDRKGYLVFQIVTISSDPGATALENMMLATLDSYQSTHSENYFDFSEGDKVAAVGAMGVLATLMGVKYGKGFFAAALAFGLLFLKKAWFLLLLPLVFLKRLFKKRTAP